MVGSIPLAQSNVEPPALRVFLCHSSVDKASVRRLSGDLKRHGIAPWLDEEKLLPGHDWDLEIKKAVRQANVVLVCFSLASVSKPGYAQKEIRLALDAAEEQPEGSIFIIPLRFDECPVPERLQRWHRVDLFQPAGLERLLLALQSRRASLFTKSARDDRQPRAAFVAPRTSVSVEIPDVIELMRLVSATKDDQVRGLQERIRGVLHGQRIIYLGTPIDDGVVNAVVAQLLTLEQDSRTDDIHVYVESQIGSITAGLAIYDTMQFVAPDVCTYALIGTVGLSTLLVASGAPGKRYGLEGLTVGVRMRSARMSGWAGQAADLEIQERELVRMRRLLNELLAKHTGQPFDTVTRDAESGRALTPHEAIEYGIIDSVVQTRAQLYDRSAMEQLFKQEL